MGFRDLFVKTSSVTELTYDVSASLAPVTTLDSLSPFFRGNRTATRQEAMSVPAIARGRNIICSSIASILFLNSERGVIDDIAATQSF